MGIFVFIKNLFRFNRNIDEDYENIWNLMIGGKAADAKEHKGNRFVNFILYIAALALTFLPWFAIGGLGHTTADGSTLPILFLIPLFLTTISYLVFLYLHKSAKFRLLAGAISCVVIGIIFGLILLAF